MPPVPHIGHLRRPLLSFVLVLLATAAQWTLWPYLKSGPFVFLYPAVALSALYGSATVALVLSVLVAQVLFLEPRFSLEVLWPQGLLLQAAFIGCGMLIAHFAGRLRIARREAQEAALRAQRQALITETLADNAAAALFMLDLGGRITFMNRAAEHLTEYGVSDLRGRPLGDLLQMSAKEGQSAQASGSPPALRCDSLGTLETRSGQAVHVAYALSPIARGVELLGSVVEVRDMTEIEAQRASLQQAVQTRDRFLSMASHELKTPLTTMGLRLHLRRRRMRSSDVETAVRLMEADLDADRRQLDRLTRLVNDMLDISRINAGKLKLRPAPCNLAALARETAEFYAPQVAESGCTLELHLDDTVEGLWDSDRLEQAVANLLTNALRYGKGKPICIEVAGTSQAAILRVRDEGVGIPDADHRRIFDCFEQATLRDNAGGLGLGLYIVQQVAALHGGTVQVESRPGRGATFTLSLPRRAEAARDPQTLPEPAAAPP
jgi:PAS domain S-box-containing protein